MDVHGGRLLVSLLLVTCLALAGCQGDPGPAADTGVVVGAGPASAVGRPDVVMFLTDDQSLRDLSAMVRTRRWMRRTGTTFTRAFSQYPLCCPARATLLTGQVAHNHGVMGNEEPWGGFTLFDDSRTLPLWLQAAGYRTLYLGKYLNGYPLAGEETYVPPGWDEWHAPVRGIYNYRHFQVNDNGTLHRYRRYQADYVRRRAVQLVTTYAAGEQPFFLWAGFLAPHAGLPVEPDDPRATHGPGAVDTPAVARRYRDSEAGRRLLAKPSVNEADMADKGPLLRDRGTYPRAQLREEEQQRREALRSVDDTVAAVLAALRRAGELDDTVVVFTSDNGFMVGEHRWNHKILGYEESARVPLLMSGPGVPRGETRRALVSLTDLPATILDLAGAEPGLPQDGISLLRVLDDPGSVTRRSLLLEAGGSLTHRTASRLYTGVRTADGHVLLRWYDGSEEVYDLTTDPFELDGGVSAAEAPRLDDLRARLAALQDCVGAECSSR